MKIQLRWNIWQSRVNRIFPEERIEHPALLTSTAFLFYLKRGLKIQTSFASRHVYSICFFLIVDWKFNPAYATRHAAASLSPNSRLNIQLSRYLTCRLDSVSFLLEERIENPELFCQSTRTQHFVSFSFSFHEEWVENSTLPLILDTLDTLTVFHFLPRAEYLTCRLDSIFFFFFTQKRGLEKSRPLLPVNLYLEFRFFFLKSELKIQLCFYQSIRWPLFNLSQERIEKSSFTRVFLPLDMWTGCFYHRVDEKDPALHNFSRYSKRRHVASFFLRFYTSFHVVRALSLVFTLCALCLSVCVCVKPCT